MQIETLREYLEFARYQNFSTAAKKLYISQPALSNHIASLEKELGVELVRRNQKLELTAAGIAFFEGSSEIVASYDALYERVKSLGQSEVQGSFSVKMAFEEGEASVLLAEMIGAFKRENPAVSVNFVKQGKNSVMDDLEAGVFDCAQLFNYSPRFCESDPDSFDSLLLSKGPLTVVMLEDHPLMSKEGLSFEDIVSYPYAMPIGAAFAECYLSVEELFYRHGFAFKNSHCKVCSTLTDLVTSCLKEDELLLMGAAPLLPKGVVYRNFDPDIYQDYCIIYKKNSANAVFKAFLEFVKHYLEKAA